MTKVLYQSMFYSLSAIVLALVFVIQPTDSVELKNFQQSVKTQFVAAGQELLAGPSPVESYVLIWNGVESFYSESANQTIALLEDGVISSIALLFDSDYQLDLALAQNPLPLKLAVEQPLMNIVPDGIILADGRLVESGDSIALSESENEVLDPNFSEDAAFVYEQPAPPLNFNGEGRVAGEYTERLSAPSQPEVVWVTITDSITGYPHCVGVFNGTVNSYPGTCAKDDSFMIYQN